MNKLTLTLMGLVLISFGWAAESSAQSNSEKQARTRAKNATQKASNKATDKASDKVSDKATDRNRKARPRITRERRQELIGFVRTHHPELERLLTTLEKNRPEKHAAAVRGLSQSYDRIQAVQDDPKKHQAAINLWKMKSRIELMAARIAIEDDPRKRQQLRRLISRYTELRAQQLEFERNRAQQRVDRIDQQLARIRKNSDQEIDRQMDLALRKIRNNLGLNKRNAGDDSKGKTRDVKKSDKPKSGQKKDGQSTKDKSP